jgi:hypothetical protein
MLLVAFIVFARYLDCRFPHSPYRYRLLVLALFGLWPIGVFFRMAYSESTLVAGTLIVLLGIAQGWHIVILAFLTGLVTAVRPVGLAVTAAFFIHVVATPNPGHRRRVLLALATMPVACWGLIVYMGYQYVAFGNPVAFAQTQEHWDYTKRFTGPEKTHDLRHKAESLLAAEPIWGVYTPDLMRNWRYRNPTDPSHGSTVSGKGKSEVESKDSRT